MFTVYDVCSQAEVAVTGGEDSMLCLWHPRQGHQNTAEVTRRHPLKVGICTYKKFQLFIMTYVIHPY